MSLPNTYLDEIGALNKEVLRAQPTDIIQFCANYFGKRLQAERAQFLLSATPPQASAMFGSTFPGRLGTNSNPFGGDGAGMREQQVSTGGISNVTEEDENDTITSPTTPNFNFNKTSGSNNFGSAFGGLPPSSNSEGFPANYGMGRRTSVSAESLNPTASINENWSPPFHQKGEEQLARLKKSIQGNFLFSHLDDEQSSLVLGALVEKVIPARGIKVSKHEAAIPRSIMYFAVEPLTDDLNH